MGSTNIKKEYEVVAFVVISRLIDEGERIRGTCALEGFAENGGAEARQETIVQWLANVTHQIQEYVFSPEVLMPFSVDEFIQTLGTLDPHPPSVAQLRHAFFEIMDKKLKLLNTMIVREIED